MRSPGPIHALFINMTDKSAQRQALPGVEAEVTAKLAAVDRAVAGTGPVRAGRGQSGPRSGRGHGEGPGSVLLPGPCRSQISSPVMPAVSYDPGGGLLGSQGLTPYCMKIDP